MRPRLVPESATPSAVGRRAALRAGGVAALTLLAAGTVAASSGGDRVPTGGRRPVAAGRRPGSTAGPGATAAVRDGPAPVGAPIGSAPDARAPGAAWTPSAPLPAPEPDGGRPVAVVLSPHPDDETLSLGVWAANAAAAGDRVIVACLTGGRTTGAIAKVAGRLGRPVTRDEIAAARERELRAAVAHLGVAPEDLYLPQLDGDGTDGGTRLTVAEASGVIEAFARRFPGATFATMSYAADHHPDHLDLGRALWLAHRAGLVRRAEFAISRLWWAMPSPLTREVLPATPEVRDRVLAAAREYALWEPAAGRYAVGYTSVERQFVDLARDPRDLVHPAGEQEPTG